LNVATSLRFAAGPCIASIRHRRECPAPGAHRPCRAFVSLTD
jgi:hypothetical protein